MKEGKQNIILSGFMATGKSSVGQRLAAVLGYDFLDLDSLIEAEAGATIPQIFAERGEAAFREMEARMVQQIAARQNCVVATGGGAVVDPRNLEALQRNGIVITLTADTETILARIGRGEGRPMLRGGDPHARVCRLLEERAPAYGKADLILDTATRSIEEIVEHILTSLKLERPGSRDLPESRWETIRVNVPGRGYNIHIGCHLLARIGDMLQPLGLGRRLALMTHPALDETYGYVRPIVESLEQAGHEVSRLAIPPGEESKSFEQAHRLCRELVRARLDRGSAVLGLGGGVIGDLAGFVAATLFRGITFINIPTTLLAQVDSSIGGKTGVNLPEGKNLVGAFHQPRLVVSDVLTLCTLPEREFRSGLAEVVKHAMIADAELFRRLEHETDRILARDPETLREIVSRSCAIKVQVVETDERETGVRAVLNFGHTVGHAVEAALGYGVVTHGEAVARGMLVAAAISVRRHLCPESDALRLRALLGHLGLLETPLPEPESLEKYVVSDKKTRDGVVQFVLTHGVGSVTLARIFDLQEVWDGLRDAA